MPKQNKNIGNAVAKGAAWMLLMKLAARTLGVVSMIILARLLTPYDFGLVAIAMSFFALLGLLAQFGFDMVLIQNQDAGPDDYNTAWTLNVMFCLLSAALLWAIAPVVARTYDDPQLIPILHAVAILYALTGAQNIGVVEFRKKLNFQREFVFATVPRLVGFCVTIPLAYWLQNYWALIVGSIVLRLAANILSYTMHPFRPRPSLKSWDQLFYFSKWLMLRNVILFMNGRSPELIIAKIISAPAAGFLTIAKELPSTAIVDVVSTINRATYPGYAMVASDIARLRALYKKVLASVSIFILPAGFGLALLADPLVPVFLGEQWLPCIPLLQALSISAILLGMNTNSSYVCMAMGNPRLPTIVQGLRLLVLLPALYFLSVAYGLLGTAVAIVLSALWTNFVTTITMRRQLGMGFHDQIEIHHRPLCGSAVMAIGILSLDRVVPNFISQLPIPYLLVQTLGGAFFYAVTVALLWWLNGLPDGPEEKILTQVRQQLQKIR